jgi:hypothetical protein
VGSRTAEEQHELEAGRYRHEGPSGDLGSVRKLGRLVAHLRTAVWGSDVLAVNSMDIGRCGYEKAASRNRLVELTGIALDDMLFEGNQLDENGINCPMNVVRMGSSAVERWKDPTLYSRILF